MTFLHLLKSSQRCASVAHTRHFISEASTALCGFYFWPTYFSDVEQRLLLAASLYKLDGTESRQPRKRRREYWNSNPKSGTGTLNDLFAPDDMYDFHKGHFDGVIHDYREMHLSVWPLEEFPALEPVLKRLHKLCPDPPAEIQTHLLHLASYGEILPHVDNHEASGSWILGVSLGNTRILRMQGKGAKRKEFSWTLPSGSVYLQRDDIRYNYLHSIENNKHPTPVNGQRLSIMIRDQYKDVSI